MKKIKRNFQPLLKAMTNLKRRFELQKKLEVKQNTIKRLLKQCKADSKDIECLSLELFNKNTELIKYRQYTESIIKSKNEDIRVLRNAVAEREQFITTLINKIEELEK